jgi:hypothetical protein
VWRACVLACGVLAAVPVAAFADQFAFWAGSDRTARSSYDVPPLVSRRAFERLIATARRGKDTLLGS